MKSRKAQGLTLNTIVIAALALIVLVVLVYIFTARITRTGEEIQKVEEGKNCRDTCFEARNEHVIKGQVMGTACTDNYFQKYGIFVDVGENQVCCVEREPGDSDPECA